MKIYDYWAHVEDDMKTYLNKYNLDPSTGWLDDIMNDVSESEEVTGTESGSYTKSKIKAQHCLAGNGGLLKKAMKLANQDADNPEKADVLIRQYIALLIVLRMTY